jgi:hypothetical protein
MKILVLACLTLFAAGAAPAAAQKCHPAYGGHPPAAPFHKPGSYGHPGPAKPGLGLSLHTPHVSVSIGAYGRPCPPPPPVWVPGQWINEQQQVWVPGTWTQLWCEPVYATLHDACGRPYQVLVQPGRYRLVEQPGRFETRCVQVWRPGYWQPGC